MKRSKAAQVATGHDRAGKPLFFHGEQFHCKVSAQDTGGDLCDSTPSVREAVLRCTTIIVKTSGSLCWMESSCSR